MIPGAVPVEQIPSVVTELGINRIFLGFFFKHLPPAGFVVVSRQQPLPSAAAQRVCSISTFLWGHFWEVLQEPRSSEAADDSIKSLKSLSLAVAKILQNLQIAKTHFLL